jgi:DNA-binding transcriptional MocR family regulator
MSRFEYIRLADAVAADIAGGALKPGDRLPPQRTFAFQRKIAASTASRVYTELLRRGLVVGEVGRGTFVSGQSPQPVAPIPLEPRGSRIDMEINYPILPTQAAMVARSLSGLERAEAIELAQRQGSSGGTLTARNTAAHFMARRGWTPNSEQFAFTANGRQCIAAALSALVPAGGRCGVEALTYPFIKGIAARLGVTLVPLAMDAQGVRPDAVQKAHREAHLSALYIQPTIQNPLGMTMPAARRADLLRVVEKLDLTVIEDSVYGFLSDEAPLAALAPDRCVVLDSLSKKVAPGFALGFVIAPPRLRENILNSIRSGGWTASGYAFAAGQRLMGDGTAAELIRLKRADAQRRQQMAAERLAGFEIQSDQKSYHLWLSLPSHWRSQTFVAAAARRDIALTPSTTFAIIPGHAPNAVRLALAAPTIEQLDFALRTLADILRTQQDDFDSTE